MLTISNPNKSGISTPSGGATTPQLNGGIMNAQLSSGGLDVKKPTSPGDLKSAKGNYCKINYNNLNF